MKQGNNTGNRRTGSSIAYSSHFEQYHRSTLRLIAPLAFARSILQRKYKINLILFLPDRFLTLRTNLCARFEMTVKIVNLTAFILAIGLSGLQAQETKKLRIAILDIKAGSSITQPEAETITGFLTTDMINSKKFHIIDRQNISKVLKEQGISQLGCTDSACEVQVGKLLAANKILTGKVSKFGDNYALNVFLTDVEKGTQDVADKVSSSTLEGLESSSLQLVEKLICRIEGGCKETSLLKNEALWRSALFPGWGQFYQNENIKGSLFLASFLGGIGIFMNSSASLNAAKGDYDSANTLGLVGAFIDPTIFGILSYSQANSAEQSMQASASMAQIGSGVAGVAYLFNLLDVAVLGNKGLTARDSGIQFRANVQNPIQSDSYTRGFERTMSIEYRWRF